MSLPVAQRNLLIAALMLPTLACMSAPGKSAMQDSTLPNSPTYATPVTETSVLTRETAAGPAADELFRLAEADEDKNATDNRTEAGAPVNMTGTGVGGALGATPPGGTQGGTPGKATPQPTPPQQPPAGNTGGQAVAVEKKKGKNPKLKKALVVEGSLTLEVAEVPEVAGDLRDYIDKIGGRVTSESLSGGERSWTGHMQVKLPPETVDDFLSWLNKRGDIRNKRIQGTDVSRTLFDQQIALDNLQLTLDRMRKLLDKEGLEMKDVLAIEREMTRLRGEIERIKGAKRFLEYRVAMATLDIHLRRREGVILGRARAKFYPGARLSTLILLSPNGRQNARIGGGVVVHTIPRLTLELDIFQATGDEPTAVIATFGGAAYSDYLGRGKRRFLNPYLGLRAGYGNLDGSAFVFAAGGGVELFKHERFLLDASVNFVGFVRKEFDATVASSLSAVFAF